jgi:UDP:flavonoid glycosyltransferase YjiC (YdhE family)
VYIDFGSNVHQNKKQLTICLEALQSLQLRAVIKKIWFEADIIPHEISVLVEIPHSWLFPQIDVIVHAYSAGMTAATLRSRKPSMTVPIRGDQYLWSKRLEKIGAAPKALHIMKLDASTLACCLDRGSLTQVSASGRRTRQNACGRERWSHCSHGFVA